MALLRAASAVKAAETLTSDEKVGYDIILRACRAPLTQIAANAGKDGGIVAEKVAEEGNFGYNALTDTYEDLVKAVSSTRRRLPEPRFRMPRASPRCS